MREPAGDAPAVALTAYAGEPDRVRALRPGFQAHLPKPVEPDALLNALTSLAGAAAPSETRTDYARGQPLRLIEWECRRSDSNRHVLADARF